MDPPWAPTGVEVPWLLSVNKIYFKLLVVCAFMLRVACSVNCFICRPGNRCNPMNLGKLISLLYAFKMVI